MSITAIDTPVQTGDGHRYTVISRMPAQAKAHLLWIPALGVAARHYLPFAEALAARGIAVHLHEWRGNGSSSLRANRASDWGYRELLTQDLPATHGIVREHASGSALIIGGHSLGGQIAGCYLGLHPDAFPRLWLVASGTPYWRTFPRPLRWTLPWFYQFAIWIARRRGALPGRQLGFGGEEARSLIRDWASVGLGGHYAAAGMSEDLDAAMARAQPRLYGVLFKRDWLAPQASLAGLIAKFPQARSQVALLDAPALGARADHFAWMKRPDAVAKLLCDSLGR